jgi:hypothetical protein
MFSDPSAPAYIDLHQWFFGRPLRMHLDRLLPEITPTQPPVDPTRFVSARRQSMPHRRDQGMRTSWCAAIPNNQGSEPPNRREAAG